MVLKGYESSLLYVQQEHGDTFYSQSTLNAVRKIHYVDGCDNLVQNLSSHSVNTVSIVTVACDPSWLSYLIRMRLANEVTYFLSLRSFDSISASSRDPVVFFPESDHWIISSSEVRGDFMQVMLERR